MGLGAAWNNPNFTTLKFGVFPRAFNGLGHLSHAWDAA